MHLNFFVRFKMIQELFPRHNFYLILYKKYVQGTLRASDKFLNSNFTKYSQCSVKFTILLKIINLIKTFLFTKISWILMTSNFDIMTTVKTQKLRSRIDLVFHANVALFERSCRFWANYEKVTQKSLSWADFLTYTRC